MLQIVLLEILLVVIKLLRSILRRLSLIHHPCSSIVGFLVEVIVNIECFFHQLYAVKTDKYIIAIPVLFHFINKHLLFICTYFPIEFMHESHPKIHHEGELLRRGTRDTENNS